MNLIDADALAKTLNDEFDGYMLSENYAPADFERLIDFAPIIDAVPVVRCGLCINRVYRSGYGGYCSVMGMTHVNDDDYCSYGERKDSEFHA